MEDLKTLTAQALSAFSETVKNSPEQAFAELIDMGLIDAEGHFVAGEVEADSDFETEG